MTTLIQIRIQVSSPDEREHIEFFWPTQQSFVQITHTTPTCNKRTNASPDYAYELLDDLLFCKGWS